MSTSKIAKIRSKALTEAQVSKPASQARLREYESLESVEALDFKRDGFGRAMIHPWQCVFVNHADVDESNDTIYANTLQKAMVISIKKARAKKNAAVELRVSWLLDKRRAQILVQDNQIQWNMLELGMAGMELVLLENQDGIISAASIVDKCYVRACDDGDPDAQWMTHQEWFYRFILDDKGSLRFWQAPGLTNDRRQKGCSCGGIYNIWRDRQLFCKTCNRWYHDVCLTKHHPKPKPPKPSPPRSESDLDHFLSLSIQRGYYQLNAPQGTWRACGNEDGIGVSRARRHFLVVGTYRFHEFCAYLKEKGETRLPEGWKDFVPDGWESSVADGWPSDADSDYEEEEDEEEEYAGTMVEHLSMKRAAHFTCKCGATV